MSRNKDLRIRMEQKLFLMKIIMEIIGEFDRLRDRLKEENKIEKNDMCR